MRTESGVAILMALVIATAAFAPPAFAASPDNFADENTFSATDNVDVWKDSILTLRHDFGSASTTIETGDYRASLGSGGETSLNRDSLGVRTAGETVELTYDPGRARLSGQDISNTDVQFIAARVTGDAEPVNTLAGAIDLIEESDNADATFEILEERSLSGGETTFEHTGSAGHYVYFVVDEEQGAFSVAPNGSLSPPDSGTSTIIGVEQITFERGSPQVSAPAVAEPGETLSFDVDTTNRLSATETVTHTILVHDQSKFSDVNQGRFRIQVADESVIDRNFDLSEEARLEHTIEEVNGDASVDDGVQVNGIDISDRRVSRAVSVGQVVDFVAEDINGQTDTTSTGDVRLDASVTAQSEQSPAETIDVGTAENWEPGTYQYVYIGKATDNSSAVVTTTGTISVQENVSVETQGSQTVDEDGGASIEFDADETVSSASFTGLKAGTTASVARLSDAPSSVTVSPESGTEPAYFEINAEPETADSPPTTAITVDRSRFSDPDDVQVFRYDEEAGEYTQVATSVVDVDSDALTVQFESDFSLFAVGEVQRADSGGGGGGGGGGGISTDFTVTNLTPQTAEVTQGTELSVSATVSTESYLENTNNVELQVGGETVASQSVTLEGRESTTVEFTQIDTSGLEGEYEHGIYADESSQTGTLTVTPPAETDEPAEADETEEADESAETDEADTTAETEPADDDQAAEETETEAGETDDGTPGFGPLIAVIALLAAALLAARRQR